MRLENSAASAEGSAREVLKPLGERGECRRGCWKFLQHHFIHLQYQVPEVLVVTGAEPRLQNSLLEAKKAPTFPSTLFLSGLFHCSDRIVTND